MSEIKIIEKIVAPNANWTQLILDSKDAALECCAYKIIFDRNYPYFWIWSVFGGLAQNGLALTYEDVKRAAVFEADTNKFTRFNFYSDGVMPFMGNMAFGIAMGARNAFYLLSNTSHSDNGGSHNFYISAQDDPVCPFIAANPWCG